MMKPEEWRQVEQLFHAALELPPEERSAFLNNTCAGDEVLRKEIESLLAHEEQARDFIEVPPVDVAAGILAGEQARLVVGRALGRYKIESLLGSGGMGEVYRAHDMQLGRDVAVKILPDRLVDNPEALRRFEREARAIAALKHPNILAIYDFGADEGVIYAVTELLEGETLHERLERSKLDWRKTIEIGIAIAEGLSAMHARGIIHRDLKPGNIFLTRDGQVKILDFGIARMKRAVSADAKTIASNFTKETRPGLMMGTPGYMSPEQVRGEPAEAPSDIFSLGCVMYEMLSGQQLFIRKTAAETIAAILKEEPPSLRECVRNSPAELERIINKALRKEAADRYQTSGDLLNDLVKLKAHHEIVAPPILFGARTKIAIAMTIGALILLLCGVAAYRIRTQNPTQARTDNLRAAETTRIEVMRYYLEIESDGGATTRVTGAEPLDAERPFRFHFTPRNRGYLYVIRAGENNVPTTTLTGQPIRETGVTTNLVEAGAEYSFPSGAGNALWLGYYGNITTFTIIFSSTPLRKPKFLVERANRQLTVEEQREMASLWRQFGKQSPELVPQTDGNQPGTAVTVTAERAMDEPIIFDIPLKRR